MISRHPVRKKLHILMADYTAQKPVWGDEEGDLSMFLTSQKTIAKTQ